MIGHGFASFASGIPEDRTGAAAFGDAAAVILMSGETPAAVVGETRRVHGLTVVNSAGRARSVEVESGGTSVSTNIGAGQTVTLAVPMLTVTWRTSPRPFWDGLNIRWKDPA